MNWSLKILMGGLAPFAGMAASIGIATPCAAAEPAAAVANPAPPTIYEVHLGGVTSTPTGPGTTSSTHGSVSIVSSPLPTLRTSIAVGDEQDDAYAFVRYYFRVNGPENVIVPVSLSGVIGLTAQAPDTGQANSYGQIDLTTGFTSDTGFIEIDRGGTVRGTVSQLFPTLHATTYTNGWNSITMRADAGARGSKDGGASGTAFVDPILSIDPSFFSSGGYDPASFSLSFSDGFGNGPAAVSGVPEPATWAMMVGGFGAIGAATRRRRRTVGTAMPA